MVETLKAIVEIPEKQTMLGLALRCLGVLLGGDLAKLRLCSHSGGILVWTIGFFWCWHWHWLVIAVWCLVVVWSLGCCH